MNGLRPHNNLKNFLESQSDFVAQWYRASDSTSEGCVFESLRGSEVFFIGNLFDSQAFRSTSALEMNVLSLTFIILIVFLEPISFKTSWRNGSASDSRSEGCVFESRRGHEVLVLGNQFDSQTF